MSRNVERIFTRLQALCDENFGQCQQDFVAHETWLCETFKANALQQLKSRKVELACPTSAKKQKKTHAAAAQPEQVRQHAPRARAPAPARRAAARRGGAAVLNRADCPQVPATKADAPAEVAATAQPPAAASEVLAAAMAAAMGGTDASKRADAPAAAPSEAAPEPASQAASESVPMETTNGTSTPAAEPKPNRAALISPDDAHAQNASSSSATASEGVPAAATANAVPKSAAAAPVPNRTLSAQEVGDKLSKLRQKLGVPGSTTKPGAAAANTPSSTSWKQQTPTPPNAEKEDAAQPAAASDAKEEDTAQPMEESTDAEGDREPEAADSPEEEPAVAEANSQKRDGPEESVEDAPASKKTKTDSSADSAASSRNGAGTNTTEAMYEEVKNISTAVTSFLPMVQKDKHVPEPANNKGKIKPVKSLQAAQAGRDAEERTQATKPAAVGVQDKLAKAAERRQQIENERLEAQRAKEKKKDVNKQKQEQQGTKRCAGNMLENAPFGRSDRC